jgi:hypothetical protein
MRHALPVVALSVAGLLGALRLAAQEPPAPPRPGIPGGRGLQGLPRRDLRGLVGHQARQGHPKLSAPDREGGPCIRCHVTGTPETIAAEGASPSLPSVQCEACHGAGQAHVESAKTGAAAPARTSAVTEGTCTACHSPASPHYKPFFFRALKGLVHKVP